MTSNANPTVLSLVSIRVQSHLQLGECSIVMVSKHDASPHLSYCQAGGRSRSAMQQGRSRGSPPARHHGGPRGSPLTDRLTACGGCSSGLNKCHHIYLICVVRRRELRENRPLLIFKSQIRVELSNGGRNFVYLLMSESNSLQMKKTMQLLATGYESIMLSRVCIHSARQ